MTAATELARVYDAIFDARFEEVPPLVARACPPAPTEACRLLEVVAVWWRIQLDPLNTARDADFQKRAEAAIAATAAWTAREPERAEVWFYLAGAYGARAQWRVLRGERFAAARDGKRIKSALERASALDPDMADAYFGLGLYHYYADVAPAILKMLRWLLLLPGGDRARGLQEMLRAQRAGALLRSEADYQLHLIYLWYEKRPERALALLRDLQARHPRNPHFRQAIADLHDVYLHDVKASLEAWQTLFDAAHEGQVAEPALAEASARLGAALQLDRLGETDAAIEHLRAVIAGRPAAPFGALARAHLQLGQALDRAGRRADAAAAYGDAIAAAGPRDPLRVAARARAALRAMRR
ncbi:MAG: hypothetical protein HYY76_14450 [Acidobacteria bacterium]|nr:hypothetical protein [Acidobacteriota bacterium]